MNVFIPETLKKYNNWLVWRNEGEGHNRKVPYEPNIDPRKRKKTDPTKPCQDFYTAFSVFDCTGDYDGLGFVFTEQCNLTFIDLDDCINEQGEYSELAEKIMNDFSDCYAEISHSETGIHIICEGKIPRSIQTKEIEMYSYGHYCAMTFNAINHNEPQEAQERLNRLFNKYKGKGNLQKEYTALYGNTTSIQDASTIINIIKRSRQGEKFTRLHTGNIQGYKSESEAAQAYIDILNYFAGGNFNVISEIVKQGYFSDTKHSRADYIGRSIKKAQMTTTRAENQTFAYCSKRIRTGKIVEHSKTGRKKI